MKLHVFWIIIYPRGCHWKVIQFYTLALFLNLLHYILLHIKWGEFTKLVILTITKCFAILPIWKVVHHYSYFHFFLWLPFQRCPLQAFIRTKQSTLFQCHWVEWHLTDCHSILRKWGSVTHQMAVPVPSISCCVS